MTTTPEVIPTRIGGGDSGRDTTNDRYPFQLGDDDTVLIGTRPPIALLLRLIAGMEDDTNLMAMAATYNEFLDKVLDDASAKRVRDRMEDPADELDLDHPDLKAMFTHLIEVWYQVRPTGGRRGSAASSSRTGKRSTARSGSRG